MKKRIDEPSHVGRPIYDQSYRGRPTYEQPHVEVIEIDVEQGFALSNPAGDSPWEDYM